MDDRTPEQRSRTMAAVKSENTKLEREFLKEMVHDVRSEVELYPVDVFGKPDFVHRVSKIAVFIDSCFWHGCPEHVRMPAANKRYWARKISRNRKRDLRVTRELHASGWSVIRVWEHSLRQPRTRKWWHTRIVNRIRSNISLR